MGTQAALAARIKAFMPNSKVKQANVWKWLNGLKGETPPPEYVIPISAAVDWKVTPHELRSDIYPDPQDGIPDRRKAVA